MNTPIHIRRSQPIDCSTDAPIDPIEQTVKAGSSSLSYDASSGQYTYVWKTDKSWAGACRRLDLGFNDSSQHQAYFQFTK